MKIDFITGYEIRFNKHPNRKNNLKISAMYDLYKNGYSLQKIGKLYRISRQAVYDLFKSRGYELRTKKLSGLIELDGIKFTIMKGGYLRGTVPNQGRMTMQKYVWIKNKGHIPSGYVIHHKNGIKTDNDINNLELIELIKMSEVFNPNGNNQFKKNDKTKII